MNTKTDDKIVPGFILQEAPRIYSTAISGKWLLDHSTPSWRIDDPQKGFQRIVREERARQIAVGVLDQNRTFPNAIILATDIEVLQIENGQLTLPAKIKFLVVDGQNRLWAQEYSDFDANYACLIHTGLTEVGMARLFLEINDNQKRVPSSLRWDLVRLVRPDDDPYSIGAADMVYSLASEKSSPLFQRIDLTGEQYEITLKQGSLTPEIRNLLSSRKSPIHSLSFEQQYHLFVQYFIAIREVDNQGWKTEESRFYKARIIRALLRLLPELVLKIRVDPESLRYTHFLPYLERIEENTLDTEKIKAVQGSAGIKAIYEQIYEQVMR